MAVEQQLSTESTLKEREKEEKGLDLCHYSRSVPQVKVIRLFGSHPQRHSISGALYWQSHRIPGGQAERPALVDEPGGQKYDGRGDTTTKVPFEPSQVAEG